MTHEEMLRLFSAISGIRNRSITGFLAGCFHNDHIFIGRGLCLNISAPTHNLHLVEVLDESGVVMQVWDGLVSYPADRPSWSVVE